jgi:hypothetical protein
MKLDPGLIFIASLLMPSLALAQASEPAPSPSSERRLSPEQIEAVLAEAARNREAAEVRAVPDGTEEAPKPQVHGEVGFSIGTGGYREAFGTTIYPMGEDGVAAISLDFVDWGKRRLPR